MLCEKCNQKPAVVFYKQTINGVTSSYNLCKNCASITGTQTGTGAPLNDLLKSFMLVKPPSPHAQIKTTCNFCRYTFDMIATSGKVGCAQCYTTFAPQLSASLRRIHGDRIYKDFAPLPPTPATPPSPPQINPINELRVQLKFAIATENYEQAATLRDQIKLLEGGTENVVQI